MSKTASAADSATLELFEVAPHIKAGTTEEIVHLELALIDVDPANPRTDADADLAESIRQEGVLQPITVRPHPDQGNGSKGRYMIVFGERRYRGSLKAGRTTIPAIVRDEANADRARRLVRQFQENFHKKLEPLQEAALLKEVRDATKFSVAQLAKISGKPKSTIEDRLALADAPAPFQRLFAAGAMTAAAAPIVRKFAAVPVKLLEEAVADSERSWEWRNPVDQGKAIPLKSIERQLKDKLLGPTYAPNTGSLREVPEKVALLFHGDAFDLGGKKVTADVEALEKAQATYDKEQEALARKTGVKKGEKPTKEKEDRWAREDRLRRSKWEIDQAKRRAEAMRFNKAKTQIFAAFAAALKKAATGAGANGISTVADLVLTQCLGQGATSEVLKLLPAGSNAESILRHAAYRCIVNFASQSYLRDREIPKLAKKFGIDLAGIIDAVSPKKKAAKPAKAKATKKKATKAKKRSR